MAEGLQLMDAGRAAFVGAFVDRVAAEDAEAYAPEMLAAAAEQAFFLLSKHRKGQALVSVEAEGAVRRQGRAVTVITLVNDNMPFLFDSAGGEVAASCGPPYLAVHPVFAVTHDENGVAIVHGLSEGADAAHDRVSVVQFHVRRMGAADAAALAHRLEGVLRHIRLAVTGWRAMIGRLNLALADLAQPDAPISAAKAGEAIAFLEWLRDDNFTFLGMREFALAPDGSLALAAAPALGILADPEVRVLRGADGSGHDTPEVRAFLQGPEPIIVTKANTRSAIHRRAYMDYIGVKLYADGKVAGELRIVGLFTATAYTRSVFRIPWLSAKAKAATEALGFDPQGHSGKALAHVLETYPRDELFQIDAAMLKANAAAILSLYERPRVRVLARRDPFDRFVSVIVYVPRERYDTQARERIGDYLKTAYGGRVSAVYPGFPEGPLARVHFIIGRSAGPTPDIAQAALETGVRAIVRTWDDALADAAEDAVAAPETLAMAARLPAAYRASFNAGDGLADAERLARLGADNPVLVDFYRRPGDAPHQAALKIYASGAPVMLSRRVPVLEHMGFRVVAEQSFEIAGAAYIHDMEIERADGQAFDPASDGAELERTFLSVWRGEADNDGYNGLTLAAGLDARAIRALRALGRYQQQAGVAQGQGFIAGVLVRHADLAAGLATMFAAKFDPRAADAAAQAAARERVLAGLDAVSSLDDDTVLRRFVQLVDAALRTNHYVPETDGAKQSFAVKLDAAALDFLPKPRPWREIFVHGPEVEGVHLRFGPVARGGLRWSDRPLDFRTEVLGLVKAQQVKNAVIVPVGAKGGFFPRRLPQGGEREAVQAAGVRAYVNYVTSLLSVTDNLVGGAVVPPVDVVRHDGDDPYFVVAADKGTATFSDTANSVAQARGFWLDDAFASGGSVGYDHKKMGITARGAWEAVKRHFREMDRDIQTTPFTVAGVGDMSGDVFGNAMLLSRQTKLVAAFDHRDIFIDPDPDAERSFAERQRLFALPRSSWRDYDPAALSPGGAIVSRAAKSVKLSPQAVAALGLAADAMTPAELMHAILLAPVDLLWFGGIGTYVRAATETDAEVGDRGNDAIRAAASSLRAKVVGEGANLAVTARGRVEFALAGGRCNSDAIDNSAGVNTSDIEVNVKIGLTPAVASGHLGREERDALLASMTDEVTTLALANNYDQTLALSLAERRAAAELPAARRFLAGLEKSGLIDRAVERLPGDAALDERMRAGRGFSRPELAVLLAYAKLTLRADLAGATLADDPALESELFAYFPGPMCARFADDIRAHRLRREIVATRLVNDAVNRLGPAFLHALIEGSAAGPDIAVAAYVVAREGFACSTLFEAIDLLDALVGGAAQLTFYEAVADFLRAMTARLARDEARLPLAGRIAALADAADALKPLVDAGAALRRAGFVAVGAPADLAQSLARLDGLRAVPDIAAVAGTSGRPLALAGAAWFGIEAALDIGALESGARALPVGDPVDALAVSRAGDMIAAAQRAIVAAAIRRADVADPVAAWLGDAARSAQAERLKAILAGGPMTLARLTVAAGMLGDMAAG